MAEKSYRIRANVGEEQVIKTCLTQDIDFLEVLSLKINQSDTYKLHVSNYGIIVGRVLANDGFGVPNAKVSVFIKLSDEDAERSDIVNLYPYKSITNKDKNNKRYNLLPDNTNDDCYKVVGTFPSKRLVLDNDTEIEIYEKYWKYTTVTNQSGDYMIFGVPTGNQTVHVDIDLSDIGILSQKPRDFFYKGYNKEQFDSAEQFKDANELDNLTQILSQNNSVYVYPFFGDKNQNEIAITRCDVNVSYKFEPTCVFIGSIISDRQGQHIGHKCGPSRHIGHNSNLVTSEGTIEMIRKTPDGLIEEFPIKANRLIDGNGVWCYQIPMNLDYICTDEFGNIIPTQDTRKGIPTRTSVRFRISLLETKSAPSAEHVAKHLVPSVYELDPQLNEPHIFNGSLYESGYEFGSATPDEFFRDLLWNKVYSIKSYIPRIDYGKSTSRHYTGIRSVNDLNNKNNVFPFNSARLRLKFSYQLLCTIMSIVVDIVSFYNKMVTEIICFKLEASFKILGKRVKISFGRPLSFLSKFIKCIGFKGHYFFEEEANIYYFPKCDKDCGDGMMETNGLKPITDNKKLKDRVQQALALEYDVVNLDFYNDWINGTLYFPLWFWRKRAKKKYFFGLFSSRAKNTFCSCNNSYNGLVLSQSCSAQYNESFNPIFSEDSDYWHRTFGNRQINYGLIKEFTNRDGLNIYYYSPGAPIDSNYKLITNQVKFTQLFATDIILLGSLNNCDLDNLPKTFDALPSSTVNLPFIATFNNDDSGDGVVSGLDWGHDGSETKIAYQNGLLIDLTCWTVHTKYKSCVNLSRLSELNVTFDMDVTTDDNNEPNIIHDGLITDKELLDHEVRAKFASLNHNGLKTLVKNPTTNYDTYKFHYIYPVNFDGHLGSMYRNITSTDVSDSNYIMYRLGEGKDSTSKRPLRHKKHFYHGSEKKFSFPLYNNSFYFYFGLKEGQTAIDKFNSEFNALCAKRNKYSFSINYKSKPGKWCYDVNKITSDFGTIDIEFNGLTDVFSYTLYNDFNEVVISEENINNHDLRFGYAIVEGGGSYIMTNDGYKKDGRIIEFNTGNVVTNSFGEPKYLENGIYYLEVINSFGLKVTQKITMTQNVLTPNFEEIRLGTKFKENVMTSQDICGEMDFYGELRLKSFIIDGEEAYITNVDNYFIDGITRYYEISGIAYYPNIDGIIEYNDQEYEEFLNDDGKYCIEIDDETIYAEYEDRRYYEINSNYYYPTYSGVIEYDGQEYQEFLNDDGKYCIKIDDERIDAIIEEKTYYYKINNEKYYPNTDGFIEYNGQEYEETYHDIDEIPYIEFESIVIYANVDENGEYCEINNVKYYLDIYGYIEYNGKEYHSNYDSMLEKYYIEFTNLTIYADIENCIYYYEINNNNVYPNNGEVRYNDEIYTEYYDENQKKNYIFSKKVIESTFENMRYYMIDGSKIYASNNKVSYNGKTYQEYNDDNGNYYIIPKEVIESIDYDQPKEVTCKVQCTDGSQIYLIMEPENDETQDISNFVCYGVGSVPSISKSYLGNVNGQDVYTLVFNIWRPGDYVITSNQICKNIMNDNVSVNTFSIENGEEFNAYINDIPLTIINNDYFKGKKIVYTEGTNLIKNDSFPRVWLQLENPLIYDFKTTKFIDNGYWDDFCNIVISTFENDNGEKINYINSLSKIDILGKQIKIISEMRNITYITQKQNNQFTITTKGGKEPIIFRNIHPLYSMFDENVTVCDSIIIDNNNGIELPNGYPLIIDENYQNEVYSTKNIGLNNVNFTNFYSELGNYFGIFTNNGGLITLNSGKNFIDTSLFSQSIPEGINVLPKYSLINNQIIKNYPQEILNKYVRLLTIDKRIIIKGEYYLPVQCQYTVDDNTNWSDGNLKLKFYNVAPLVYDDFYNIIGNELSYEIKKVSEVISKEEISSNRELNIEVIEDNKYQLTITNNSYFNGCGEGIPNYNTIKGNNYSEILIKLRSICDTIAVNVNYIMTSDGIPSAITFNKLEEVNSESVFNSDSDIRITSNLMWYSDLCNVSSKKHYLRSKGKLYTCMYSIDGNEYDIRDNFDNYLYSSESFGTNNNNISFSIPKNGNISTPYGHSFAIEVSNCKMVGELEYEKEQHDDGIHYNFKSFVESGDVNKKEMTIDNRINVKSAVLFFTPKKYGKYTIVNDYKVYEKNSGHDDLLVSNAYYNQEKKILIFVIDGIERHKNIDEVMFNEIAFNDENKTSGYVWTKKTIIHDYDNLTNDFISGESINLSYEELKDRFNKYGIPIYSKLINDSGNTSYYFTFDPHVSGKTSNEIKIYNFAIEEGINEFLCKVEDEDNNYFWILTSYDYYVDNSNKYHTYNLCFYEKRITTTRKIPIKGSNGQTINVSKIVGVVVSSNTKKMCYLSDDNTLKHISSERITNIINGEEYVNVDNEFKKVYWYYKSISKDDNDNEITNYYHNYNGIINKIDTSNSMINDNIYQFISERMINNNYVELRAQSHISDVSINIPSNVLKISDMSTVLTEITLSDNDFKLEDDFNKYTIHSVEDFSCTILKDEFGDNYDTITAYAPFLSYGIKKQYGMMMTSSSITKTSSAMTIDSFVNNSEIGNIAIPKSNIHFLTEKYGFFENNGYPYKSNEITVNRKLLNLDTYNNGLDYAHIGTVNIKNYINENINVNMVSYNSSIANHISGFNDNTNHNLTLIRRYKKDVVIGDIYPYINKNFYDINEFEINNNAFGCPYGQNYALSFKHRFLSDDVYDVIGVSVYQPITLIKKDGEESKIEIDELNEYYENLLYVFQPNTCMPIDENVEIITCNFVKTYEDNGKNYNRGIINQFSQNVLFHVGPLYLGNATLVGEDFYIPCMILDKNMNEDIINIFSKWDFKYYFNNKEYSVGNIKSLNKGLKYYQINCTDGYSNYYSVNDNIKIINNNVLIDISIKDLIINPYGKQIYHFEEVDGKYYDFMSIIEDIKEITNIYYLEVGNKGSLNSNMNLVLTIQIDKAFYKFPFHTDGNNDIKTGFL